MNTSQEQDAQILYDFAIGTILPVMSEDGVWSGTDPWPLSAEIIEREFRRIAEHEAYSKQTIMCESAEGKHVTLANGHVKITDHFNPPWAN